jgi:hypothetical protein
MRVRVRAIAVLPLAALLLVGIAAAAAVPAQAAGAWLPSTTLSSLPHPFRGVPISQAPGIQTVAGAVRPQVAISETGEAVAIWERFGFSGSIVQVSTWSGEGGWSAPIRISRGPSAHDPQLAITPSGMAIAVWRRYVKGRYVLEESVRPPGQAWSAQRAISSPSPELAGIRVAIDASGTATAVWVVRNRKGSVIRTSTRSPLGNWSAPVALSRERENGLQPQLAINAGGEALVAWEGGGRRTDFVASASRAPSGAWSPPVRLTASDGHAGSVQVGLDDNGEAVAFWERSVGEQDSVLSSFRPRDGAWSTPLSLASPREDASSPRLAVNPAGEAVAAWLVRREDRSLLRSASRLPGGAWSGPLDLPAETAYYPQLDLNDRGETVLIWGGLGVIESASLSRGDRWSSPTLLGSLVGFLGGYATRPRVASTSTGEAVALWEVGKYRGEEAVEYAIQGAFRPAQ